MAFTGRRQSTLAVCRHVLWGRDPELQQMGADGEPMFGWRDWLLLMTSLLRRQVRSHTARWAQCFRKPFSLCRGGACLGSGVAWCWRRRVRGRCWRAPERAASWALLDRSAHLRDFCRRSARTTSWCSTRPRLPTSSTPCAARSTGQGASPWRTAPYHSPRFLTSRHMVGE